MRFLYKVYRYIRRYMSPEGMRVFYLAHPFDSRHEVREWEKLVEADSDITLINPFYDLEGEDMAGHDAGRLERYEDILASDIVDRDVEAIYGADGVVAYISGALSYGTIMEIVYAYSHAVPVYLICTNGHEGHPWLKYHAKKIFLSLDDAHEFLRSLNHAT